MISPRAIIACCRSWRTDRCKAIHGSPASHGPRRPHRQRWALAITLRITLVENLRRLADAIVARLAERQLADTIADRTLGSAKSDPEPASTILRSLDQTPWSTAFAVELSQRLRDLDPDITPALRWLDDRLRAEGTATDRIIRSR
jgi:cyclic beta-1,2-glucan synthetase